MKSLDRDKETQEQFRAEKNDAEMNQLLSALQSSTLKTKK
jgi:hypothetical protein